MNRTPTRVVHDVTYEERFTIRKDDLIHLKAFSCIAYVHVSDKLRTKLDLTCVFIEYSLEQKEYECYNPITHEVRLSKDVAFDELTS